MSAQAELAALGMVQSRRRSRTTAMDIRPAALPSRAAAPCRLLLACRAERRGCRGGQVMSRGGLYEAGVLHMLD
eukprot:SAG11_NODE_21767_length_419_cov_0.803125_1_plen_73_part_10